MGCQEMDFAAVGIDNAGGRDTNPNDATAGALQQSLCKVDEPLQDGLAPIGWAGSSCVFGHHVSIRCEQYCGKFGATHI